MQGKLLGREQLALMKQGGFWSGGDPTGCGDVAYGHSGGGAAFKTERLGLRKRAARRGPASERSRRCGGGRPRRSDDDPPLLRRRFRVRAVTLRGHHVFAAAAAVVALHTIVDAFVALEPGVEPADHAVSGLVPLALLAVAVAGNALAPAGLRAVLALALGVLAVEGFVLAVADALAGGVRGDDWTGFALGPAGLALIVLGVALLWRSRKPHGRRLLRRSLLGAVAVLGIYWVLLPVGIGLMATHRPQETVETVDLGRPSRSVTAADGGRARPARALRALAERRRDHRLPRQRQPRRAGACARPPRLRRAHARPARLRRERGRPEHVRLERREGRRRRRRLLAVAPTSATIASAASASPSAAK